MARDPGPANVMRLDESADRERGPGIRRFRDPRLAVPVVTLLTGAVYVTRRPEILMTVLGSCVAVCLYSTEKRIAGMNHYLLPESGQRADEEVPADPDLRYGVVSLRRLVDRMLARGVRREELVAKVFGGGKVVAGIRARIGEANVQLALDFLVQEGIEVTAIDVGGGRGRKLLFDSRTGKVFVLKLRDTMVPTSTAAEVALDQKALRHPLADVHASDLLTKGV